MMKTQRFAVPAGRAGAALLDVLAEQLAMSRRKAKGLLDARRVFVNGRRVWMAHHRLAAGDRIELGPAPPRIRTDAAPPPTLYADASYRVVDKPPGIVTTGADGLEGLVRRDAGDTGWHAVHRLDRDTSGCVLFAHGRPAFEQAVALFRAQRVEKGYAALVLGEPRFTTRRIAMPLNGARTVSRVRVLKARHGAAHVAVRIETGRTHQIRRHLSALGHPVLGDRVYGTRTALPPALRGVPRQMIHAAVLEFPHPESGKPVRVRAPLPADFRVCLARLGLR
jgi:23S rRNA pseudouridine1911/1915/1917 synthase